MSFGLQFRNINSSHAIETINHLPLGANTNTAGFGIITESIRQQAISVLQEQQKIDWKNALRQNLTPIQAEEIIHAIYMSRGNIRGPRVHLSDMVQDELDYHGGQGLIFERILAHAITGIYRDSMTLRKTPEYIDMGKEAGPGIDLMLDDKRTKKRWGVAVTIKRPNKNGIIYKNRTTPTSQMLAIERELIQGSYSSVWYDHIGTPKFPEEYIPSRIIGMNFRNIHLNLTQVYWAYVEWKRAGFKGELYDFFASPTRERLTYFIEIFGHIWNIIQDLTTSGKLGERLKDGSYFIGLPDNGGIYSTQQHNYIALEVRMHDCIGYSHICTIEIPNKAHMNFIRSLTEDMRKMGWK